MSEKSFLSKEIKLGKDVYPSKKTMNFIVDENAKKNKASIILFCIFLVGLVFFTKFGVIDSLTKTSSLENNYKSYENEINALQAELSDYDEVEEKYNELVGDFLTDEEVNSLNRTDIIDMIDDDILPYVDVTNISISGNEVSVYTGVTDLNTVSKVLSVLQNDERTEYVTVSRTLADSSNTDLVTADIEITYKDLEG